jgi:DNA polymerase-3 subunit alpha
VKAVSLHHHSTFSFGDGYGTPAQHAARAAELGYTAMALTEHGNVSSHFQFEKAALKAGIRPIFGLEAYCGSVLEENDERRLVQRGGEVELLPARSAFKNHLTLLATTARGYRNLNKIVTGSYRDYYYHPTVSGGNLAANAADIVALSGCSGSLLACSLLGGKGSPEHNDDPDFESARSMRSIVGRHRWTMRCGNGTTMCLSLCPRTNLNCSIVSRKPGSPGDKLRRLYWLLRR